MSKNLHVPDDEPDPDPLGVDPPEDEAPAVFRGVHLVVAPDQRPTALRPATSSEPIDKLKGQARASGAPPPPELRTELTEPSQAAPPASAPLDIENLYVEHYDRLLRAVRRFCAGDHALAEEVTQETFEQALRRINLLAQVANPYAWLHAVACNIARRCFRQQGRRREKENELHLRASRECLDEDWSLEDLIQRLPERERRAIEYRFIFDYDRKTIAKKMECSTRSVDNYISQGLRQIRRALNLVEEG